MKWFKKKKKQFDVEIIRQDIPLTTLARWYIYDTELDDPNVIAESLGMNPDSEEGADKQRQDSDLRLEQIDYLLPFLDMMANIAADTITAIQLKQLADKDPDNKDEMEREAGTMRIMYKVISMSGLIGAFSAAVELGLVHKGDIQNLSQDIADLGDPDE